MRLYYKEKPKDISHKNLGNNLYEITFCDSYENFIADIYKIVIESENIEEDIEREKESLLKAAKEQDTINAEIADIESAVAGLCNTDYRVIKCVEQVLLKLLSDGVISSEDLPYDISELVLERQNKRDRINKVN